MTVSWRPLSSVRGRILGWSVLLLATALAVSSAAAHLLEVQQLDGWVEVGSVVLLVGSALAWLVAGRMLAPIREITELARRITETDISGRIPVRGQARGDSDPGLHGHPGSAGRQGTAGRARRGRGNEITELARTLNQMLGRLEAALTIQRRFLADAGHELRTPITIIQGNLDTLTVSGEEDAGTLAIVADELARMSRLVDELTLLAKSERPDFLHPAPTDLGELTLAMAAKARGLDPASEQRFTLTARAEGQAILDPQRITQAVMQLAANAVEHTPPGTPVEIGSAIVAGAVEFRVADHGAGIPAKQRDRVFERFARLDPRRTEGSGLGLAIVAAIAAAHGGSVSLADRVPLVAAVAPGEPAAAAGGAEFILSIPLRLPSRPGHVPRLQRGSAPGGGAGRASNTARTPATQRAEAEVA